MPLLFIFIMLFHLLIILLIYTKLIFHFLLFISIVILMAFVLRYFIIFIIFQGYWIVKLHPMIALNHLHQLRNSQINQNLCHILSLLHFPLNYFIIFILKLISVFLVSFIFYFTFKYF